MPSTLLIAGGGGNIGLSYDMGATLQGIKPNLRTPGWGDSSYWGAHFANRRWVLVGGRGGTNGESFIATSDDPRAVASSWVRRESPMAPGFIRCVAYGDGRWVIGSEEGGPDGGFAYSDDDGVTWTLVAAPQERGVFDVIYSNGLWVACSGSAVMTSPDGINWSVHVQDFADPSLFGVAHADGVWVVGGDGYGQGVIGRSTNGSSYTKVDTGGDPAMFSTYWGMSYANGRFWANGHRFMSSPDGSSWTVESPSGFTGLTPWETLWTGDRYIVVDGGDPNYVQSLDGQNWTKQPLPWSDGWGAQYLHLAEYLDWEPRSINGRPGGARVSFEDTGRQLL